MAFASLIYSFYRLFYGVVFTDEAFYAALAYRFVLGSKPLVDEWNIGQTAALLITPLLNLYVSFMGNEGIVLFCRFLYFALSLSIMCVVYLVLRPSVPRWQAFVGATFLAVYVPFEIPAPSYNTLGSGFYLMGCMLLLLAFRSRSLPLYFLAGSVHALGLFAYPPLIFAEAVFVAYWIWAHRSVHPWLPSYVAGGILVGLVLLLLVGAPLTEYQSIVQRTSTEETHFFGWIKIKELLRELFVVRLWHWLLLIIYTLSRRSLKDRWRVASDVFLLTGLFFFSRGQWYGRGVADFILFLSVAVLVAARREARGPAFAVLFPMFAAAGAMAWASNNGWVAGSVALGVGISLYAVRHLKEGTAASWVVLLMLFTILVRYRTQTFRENNLWELTHRVTSGPYRGLYTTREKSQYLGWLSSALAEAKLGAKAITFYPHFPAGYLLTNLRPGVPWAWNTCPSAFMADCIGYFKQNVAPGDLLVKVKGLMHQAGAEVEASGIHPFDGLLGDFVLVTENEYFAIYRLKNNQS